MKIVVLLVVAASLPFALAGCSSSTCEQAYVVSDTSSATYSAQGAIASSLGASSQGSFTGLSASASSLGASTQGSVAGLSASALSASTLQLTGYVGDAMFTCTVPNVPASGSASLAPGSSVSLIVGIESIAAMSGTIDVTSFSTSCAGGACVLSIVGTLKGTATLPDGSTFSMDASLNHSEELQSYACGSQGYAE